jgi:hypothetical protein
VKKPVTGTPVHKAKVHHHVKPVTKAVKAHRHAAAVKAAKTRAANAKKAKQHPRRQLALGDGVACCSAEALAMSLRLAGAAVSDEDVLELYWRTAADADAGASILATLAAAAEFGLAAERPVRLPPFSAVAIRPGSRQFYGAVQAPQLPLILGINLPGPHAVLATADGWWSWGELYEPWTDDIDEAWEVTW